VDILTPPTTVDLAASRVSPEDADALADEMG
jgi:hypothetical protein